MAKPEAREESSTSPSITPSPTSESRETSRLHLLWDVFAFQFKLAADGLRDLLLSPISIVAAIMGLIVGGDDPYRYFRELLRLGRRSEIWLNLFGTRKHEGTSDDLIAPLKERVLAEAQYNPWISKAGAELNKTLDTVSGRVKTGKSSDKEDKRRRRRHRRDRENYYQEIQNHPAPATTGR